MRWKFWKKATVTASILTFALGVASAKANIEQLEDINTDAILDLGLSKFEHREKFRKFAQTKGYQLTLHFLDISKETRLNRVMKRNDEKGETFEFEVTKENFDFMESWFEKPTKEEMKNGITITE